MSSDTPVYLPRMRTRIGKAGYKGKNVRIVEPGTEPDGTAIVTAPAPKAVPKSATKATGKAAPKAGIKALKSTAKK